MHGWMAVVGGNDADKPHHLEHTNNTNAGMMARRTLPMREDPEEDGSV